MEGLTATAAPRDSDGMPDTWEATHGLDSARDDSARVMGDGYTAIERYLNGLAARIAQGP
jgi:hypothetical protein